MPNKKLLKESFEKLCNELKNDLNGKSIKNDITSNYLLNDSSEFRCEISNRENIILCGAEFVRYFFKKKFPKIKILSFYNDGAKLKKNSKIFSISGNSKVILATERTVLNFLQHLSSISTLTHKFILAMNSTKTKLKNTRKTTPGLRVFEKYATVIGGAIDHRMGLFDQILVKDNHIKALGKIETALSKLNKKKQKFQIECENIDEVKKSIGMGAKYILLDNMRPKEIQNCIKLRNNKNIEFEITGGISINNISKFSNLGADYISTGKITNSANSVDIGLDII